jgi:hypothetical protein
MMRDVAKRCPRCEEHKPRSAYGPSRRRRDGLRVWCRDCERDDSTTRRHGYRPPLSAHFGQRHAIFVCLCETAVVDHSNAGACRCGLPIVSRMHPDNQAVMAEKYPEIFDQAVIDPAHQEATA